MSFAPGSRIGHYEVVCPLGTGGMGEVYRARDTRLGREVALKFVLEAFVGDRERLARFEREARALAALNHPGIATLHGLEQAPAGESSSPVHFLVMELVEGETLDQVLAGAGHTGPRPLPLERAIAIARQMAEALEAAHEKGIVHRDLKPANVKITPDDKVKVLDFGLAKAMGDAAGADGSGPGESMLSSPTMSAMATARGVILGTAAYMSPEQARGARADHRSDIFSFGIVFYEMLTGRHPFPGETVSDVLASVLAREPDHSALPSDLAPRLVDLVRRCLEKHPRQRWQAIGDVRYELEQVAAAPRASASVALTAAAPAPGPLWKRALPVAVAAILASAITAGVVWLTQPSRPPAIVTRFPLALGEGQLTQTTRPAIAISPDGTRLAYIANAQVYVRSMWEVESRPLKSTGRPGAGPYNITFSPDGRSIAYWQDGQIRTVEAAGAEPVPICGSEIPFGMTWSGDAIFFADTQGIRRVRASGGEPELLVSMENGETAFRPQLLPGGKALLFTVAASGGPERWDNARVVVHALDTGVRTTLLEGGSDARYAPSSPGAPDSGHLLYAVSGVLFARSFDVSRLAVFGSAISVVTGVRRGAGAGGAGVGTAHFSVSDTGTLVYFPGPAIGGGSNLQIVMVDRSGGTSVANVSAGPASEPRMSPNGRRIAFGRDDGRDVSIWVQDVAATGSAHRLTFGGRDRYPAWTADSRRVVFQSDREGDLALFWQRADEPGTAERLTRAETGVAHVPLSASPDGAVLLVDRLADGKTTLLALSLKDRKAAPFGGVASITPTGAAFSPDGRWVAYSSREAAAPSNVVFVQPFPATGTKFQISPNVEDGHHPIWTADGKELLYNPGPGGRLAAVTVSTAKGFAFGPGPLYTWTISSLPPTAQRPFDAARDGKLLVALRTADAPAGETLRIDVVLNWFEELRARAPVK